MENENLKVNDLVSINGYHKIVGFEKDMILVDIVSYPTSYSVMIPRDLLTKAPEPEDFNQD